MSDSSTPMRAWCWLAGPFCQKNIRGQLEWVRANNFGASNSRAENSIALAPLVFGSDLPGQWARRINNELIIFFAHPLAKEIRSPMATALRRSLEP